MKHRSTRTAASRSPSRLRLSRISSSSVGRSRPLRPSSTASPKRASGSRLFSCSAYWREALAAFDALCRNEGIIPALETAHAVAEARKLARALGRRGLLVVNVSGRGDKDVEQVRRAIAERAAAAGRARSRRRAGRSRRSRP